MENSLASQPTSAPRRIRMGYFDTWARGLEDAAGYLARVPQMNLAPLVSDAGDAKLMAKARLDCDG